MAQTNRARCRCDAAVTAGHALPLPYAVRRRRLAPGAGPSRTGATHPLAPDSHPAPSWHRTSPIPGCMCRPSRVLQKLRRRCKRARIRACKRARRRVLSVWGHTKWKTGHAPRIVISQVGTGALFIFRLGGTLWWAGRAAMAQTDRRAARASLSLRCCSHSQTRSSSAVCRAQMTPTRRRVLDFRVWARCSLSPQISTLLHHDSGPL